MSQMDILYYTREYWFLEVNKDFSEGVQMTIHIKA